MKEYGKGLMLQQQRHELALTQWQFIGPTRMWYHGDSAAALMLENIIPKGLNVLAVE